MVDGRVADVGVEGFGAKVAAAVARTGPLCAGIDPSGELLARLGSERRRRRSARSSACGASRPLPGWCRWSSPRWPSSSGAARPAWPHWSRCWRRPARPDSWSSPTPSGATSGAPWRPTPGPGSIPASPLRADAVTAAPYLGLGALQPMIDLAGVHRPGGDRGGPELQPRGPVAPGGPDRRRTGTGCGGHAAGRDRRAQSGRPGPAGHRGRRGGRHPRPVGVPPGRAGWGDPGARGGGPGGHGRRGGGPVRGVPPGLGAGQLVPVAAQPRAPR